jgi:hypothetical protein
MAQTPYPPCATSSSPSTSTPAPSYSTSRSTPPNASGKRFENYDALLATRPEERATLLVRGDNPARHLYLKWGWKHVGYVQPYPDSPRFESMTINLHPASPPD